MDLKKYIGNQIKTFRKSAGFTQDELAKRLNTTKQTISRYEKGERKANQDMLFKLCDIFDISIDDFFPIVSKNGLESTNPLPNASDLLTQQITDKVVQLTIQNKKIVLRTSEKLLESQKNEEETKENEVSEVIQLYSYDYYDHPASAGTGQYLNDVRVEQIELPIDVDADFVIPIKGDSMEPDYHDGDLVFIQTSVFNYNGDAYIKQLVIDKDQAYLHSLNPAYKDMPITPDTDFRIIGEVVDLYREG